jgi:hypothetical protein
MLTERHGERDVCASSTASFHLSGLSGGSGAGDWRTGSGRPDSLTKKHALVTKGDAEGGYHRSVDCSVNRVEAGR